MFQLQTINRKCNYASQLLEKLRDFVIAQISHQYLNQEVLIQTDQNVQHIPNICE